MPSSQAIALRFEQIRSLLDRDWSTEQDDQSGVGVIDRDALDALGTRAQGGARALNARDYSILGHALDQDLHALALLRCLDNVDDLDRDGFFVALGARHVYLIDIDSVA